THERPPVGPVALPRELLALDVVDPLQAEEAPAHGETELLAQVAQPQRGLIGERAHRVEMEIHTRHVGCSGIHADQHTRPRPGGTTVVEGRGTGNRPAWTCRRSESKRNSCSSSRTPALPPPATRPSREPRGHTVSTCNSS